jgi:hypothetical protein
VRRVSIGLGHVLALCALCVAFFATPAAAAEFPYILDPELSLTGDCSTSERDPVKDPDCQPTYPAPPEGPAGRFNQPRSIAVDAHGNVYVASYGDKRIDVFDDEGSFITELADPHGPKSIAVDSEGNLYVFEQGEGSDSEVARYSPTVYDPDKGEIEYGKPRVVIDTDVNTPLGGVAVDPSNDHLYVSWWSTFITEYDSAADGNDLLNTITHPQLSVNNWVAMDGERRRLYASSCKNAIFECVVLVFEADAPYGLLEEVDGSTTPANEFRSSKGWLGMAVDETNGHLFVADLEATKNVYEFGEDYGYLSKTVVPVSQAEAVQIAVSNSPLNPASRNLGYLFVPLGATSGSALAFAPPEVRDPEVNDPAALNIGETEAEVRAIVDPNAGDTAYKIEYMSEAEFAKSGFATAVVAGEGTIPGTSQPQQVSAFVSGLLPGSGYRFRVVAENLIGDDEAEAAFVTHSDAPVEAGPCSNQILRAGPSLALPDCRAYELVTPPDTNGNPPAGAGLEGDRFGMVQSSPQGGAVSFELLGGSLPGTEGTGSFYGDPYKATRGADGWITAVAGPTGAETSKLIPGSFSPDQGYNFWTATGAGTAVVGGVETRYVRYPDGHSELVGRGSLGTEPRALGMLITEGATHIVFQTQNLSGPPGGLEPNAPPTGTSGVYDRTRDPATGDEETHVVSLLPGDLIPAAGEDAVYVGASADGESIAFEIAGTLYLRKHNAVTYEVADDVEFAGISEGGERIFYVEAGDMLAFDTGANEVIEFAETGDAIAVNVAPQGTRAYFVSEAAISGSGPNPNGASPQAGAWNLYLSEEGQVSFVATVIARDVEGVAGPSGTIDGLGLWTTALETRKPGFDPSRTTPDGAVLLFQSRANLAGYEPGKAPQIYRYDSAAGDLECLSCPPTKTPATGGASLQSFFSLTPGGPFGPHGFVPGLRADGKRAFFESTEALVSGDTDKLRDVYEWEAQGVGSCERTDGCVYLISSGHSGTNDFLFGHSASGDDVFFTTTDGLIEGDEATLSVYDAKVGGGFAKASPPVCSSEVCRPPVPAPTLPPSASDVQTRSGNVVRGKKCPPGKRKVKRNGKSRCVKKKHRKRGKHHRGAAGKRRGG